MQIKISFCSVFPDMYENFFQAGIVGRAVKSGLVEVNRYRFADFVLPKKRIDEPICGHGAGMVLGPEVVGAAIEKAREVSGESYTVFFSPHGNRLDQKRLSAFAKNFLQSGKNHLICVAGRYEGIDARVEEKYADEVISIGDYVLMAGDLPAMVFTEAFLRLVPGVIGDNDSVVNDSFSTSLVDFPHFCLPVVWQGYKVPAVILSGNHQKINEWRADQAFERTMKYHSRWFFESDQISGDYQKLFLKNVPSHYVVLMHDQVLVGPEKKNGTTSVTSLDIHDIARSAKTYGIKGYFIVTPLIDQQRIVQQFLDFWHEGRGVEYNKTRHSAIEQVEVVDSLEVVLTRVAELEKGLMPLLIATSARIFEHKTIDFHNKYKVWKEKRPVLFVLGTGQGLAESVMEKADFVLVPIQGLTRYNHLSVRSAAAIIFDRWLGLNPRIE
jgi:tRNA (guanine37-N1)-methyltransferase